ncbi:hypothetical protein [Endozoicomonas sp. GU-1]|uniref:hypothetical protein n=1 Tax=Endozoicomonas sp. GU-1 TaxID=3009078 RepID=UPI0022B58909|nr:hypothetical protein [Endozoicomonas sp. GU-1]WBA82991.1 hypothetical protein O2T12_07680 [Endozoicomonas sp. GU-1]WBA85914.1 hypothetical protein O3276_22310 [Endozoicomonas sp. GU-1]
MKKWVPRWDIPLIMVILVVEILLINAFSGPDNAPFSLSVLDAVVRSICVYIFSCSCASCTAFDWGIAAGSCVDIDFDGALAAVQKLRMSATY